MKKFLIALFLFSGLFALHGSGTAFAATVTWTGTACNVPSGADCNWSTASNWGGTAPVNADDVVFDNTVLNAANAGTPNNDITSLTLNSIVFQNNGAVGEPITLTEGLTITSAITQQPSVTTTTNSLVGPTGVPTTITLGGDVTVTSTTFFIIGKANQTFADTIALGGNKLTFAGTDAGVNVAAIISGAGTVEYNAPGTTFTLDAQNTYSGITNAVAAGVVTNNNGNNIFGTSTINISNASHLTLKYDVDTTISNAINIDGISTTTPVDSITFARYISGGPAITITVPAITLNGNTSFYSSLGAGETVNLAGITANGFCATYLKADDASVFANGPSVCAANPSPAPSAATTVGTPNTGLALLKANPLVTLLATLASTGALFIIARKYGVFNKQ